MKYKMLYLLISTIIIGAGLFSVVKWGYVLSIDFIGGTNLEYQLPMPMDKKVIEDTFKKENIEIVTYNQKDNVVSIRTKTLTEQKEGAVRKSIETKIKNKITVLKFETVGPVLGRETMIKTGIASLVAILGILLYMTFAFKGLNFALAAIIALLHDFFVVIGTYSLFSHFLGAQVDTLFVTALLTTMSFSVHDTIIIFDKIREYKKKEGLIDIEASSNKALMETLVRSLNNSITIMFMLVALVLLGGTTIRFFALTLLVGTITGTYSSPFVAVPVLIWLEKRRKG
ncbi:MAG: protein translocase subunit SecF [bacterium]|nr:protein translocase subunit SecF [bacterium]